ncbi:MAG: hypothetical protein ACREPB_13245 [Arenimonas sp.]
MTDLHQLHEALESIKQNRKTAKLFFYFVNKDDGQMQSGFFSISEGNSCCISYLNKPNETALAEIPHLRLTKVMSLPATLMDLSNQPFPACELDDVLNRLNPANFIKTAPDPIPEPEPVFEQVHAETATPAQPHVFYSHVTMQQDAIHLLESLYGAGAAKRVEEIALTLPPHQYPTEFLDKCKLHASMMLGPKKADEIFQSIYDKLAHGHGSHH